MKPIQCLILALSLLTIRLPAEDKPEVESEVLVESGKMWDGSRLPYYPKERPEITVLKVTIPPGATVPWHKHPSINACYVISGELTVVAKGGEELKVRKGDAFLELVDKWHYGKNNGAQPVELVIFYAGRRDLPLSIEK